MYTIRRKAALWISIFLLVAGGWQWQFHQHQEKLIGYGFIAMSVLFLLIWLAQKAGK